MAFGFWLGVSLLLLVWSITKCADIPNGVLDMECRDRYLMIAADLSFTGDEPRFEAVDDTGVYPITSLYAAECGYTVSILPLPGHVELRASYFSCHADNDDDKVFTFNFNLIATDGDRNVAYALNKTCYLSLPWFPREVSCEVNYMEVSLSSAMTCPPGTKKDDWDASLTAAYNSATSDWQVMFQREGQQLTPMNISDAREKRYVFDVTYGRLVFRTPYGQPDSVTTLVDGVSVEVVHPTLFSRRSWVVLMVDLVAACSMDEGSYNGGRVVWETPEVLYSGFGLAALDSREINMGVNGQLVEQPIAMERGYNVETHGATVQISIPYNAEGGYRKRFVLDNMYEELYVFNLYVEQIFVDDEYVDTRLRVFRPLATPLLSLSVSTVNHTVLEERRFTVYIGDFPEDVELAAVKLNGQDFSLPFTNTSRYTISKVLQTNDTTGYTLEVPFEDPIVITKLSKDGVLQHILDINYTLTILPENETFYHLASVVALMINIFPPVFEAVCSETGISFMLDYRPFDYLWVVYIGPNMLTPELADRQGYIMHNDSQRLFLDVPLSAHGYIYKDIGLKTFLGTFALHIHNSKTLELEDSSVKTCPFSTTELIMCSTDGKMTVVADVSMAIPSGESATTTSLQDENCRPEEADDTRVLFSFGLTSCGTRVKLAKGSVTYENEIVFNPTFLPVKNPASSKATKVTLQCVYPLSGLYRLFSVHKFDADAPGVGRIVHPKRPVESSLQPTTIEPTTIEPTTIEPTTTTEMTTSTTERPISNLPAMQSPVRYVRVFSFLKDFTDTLSKKNNLNQVLEPQTLVNFTG